jgi:hypothetical protein
MNSASLTELGGTIAQEFAKGAGAVMDSWSEADRATFAETAVDAARVAVFSMIDPESAKTEKAIVDATLGNLKVAAGFKIHSEFWAAVKRVLAVVAPILLKSLLAVVLI